MGNKEGKQGYSSVAEIFQGSIWDDARVEEKSQCQTSDGTSDFIGIGDHPKNTRYWTSDGQGIPTEVGKKAGAIECLVNKTERLAEEAQKLEERLLLTAKVHFGLDSVTGEEQKEKSESSMDRINSNLTHISRLFYKLDDLLKEM